MQHNINKEQNLNNSQNYHLNIVDIKCRALIWWNKLDKLKQRTIERETFGDGEPWEDNTLTDIDIVNMYMQYYS